MARTISVDDLSQEITRVMKEYAGNVADEVKKDVDDIAKETVKKVKSKAPVRSGKGSSKKKHAPGSYKKSWTSTVIEENSHRKSRTIYSKNQYQLAHLLEKEHTYRLPTGRTGKSRPIPHIQPAEEWAVNELQRRTIRSISDGV